MLCHRGAGHYVLKEATKLVTGLSWGAETILVMFAQYPIQWCHDPLLEPIDSSAIEIIMKTAACGITASYFFLRTRETLREQERSRI